MSRISFRRYTTLPFLLDILNEKRIALLDPASWEDRNDAFYMELYKQKKKLKTLLALCFAEAPETYQHWKIYSGSSSGICVEFNKTKLLTKIKGSQGFRYEKINYRNISVLKKQAPSVEELPFIKRYAFQNEYEFRIIYEDEVKEIKIKYIPVLPEDIMRVIINPWVNQSVFNSIEAVLKNIKGFDDVRIKRSGVVENEKWKSIGTNATATRKK